ncbi:MAG: 16S rRNA (adenine(1518)-N(6)/adenine(1519)-N(6))-dimethyltransferase RsmA [Candidatus Dojkabacteria bacterium]|jgi:16S rRNA (adenine1518-N6/adenine1519-N6)-dimethyltransferase
MKEKKSLGQNFFVNKNLAEQIVKKIVAVNHDVIVEIGAGEGYFTNIFNSYNENVIIIEKDDNLAKNLSLTYPNYTILNKDFLDWDFSELENYSKKRILFFGSLPYNVSKKIIKKIIISKYFNTQSFFIIQKEVAQKYTDREPNNNLLSLQTEIFTEAKKLFDISPTSFRPKPKVNSSLITFKPLNRKIKNSKDFENFLIRCFKQPRKTLANNLKGMKFEISDKEKDLLDKRPQHLSFDQYLTLFQKRI